MATSVKMKRVGEAVDISVDAEQLHELGLDTANVLYVTRTPGGVKLSPYDPEFAKGMEIAREFMETHNETMQELAK